MNEKAKKIFRFIWGTVKVVFIVLLLYIGSLFFRDQKIPDSVVAKMCDRVSSSGMLVRCDRAAVGFRRGLVVRGVRLYDSGKPNCMEPVASVAEASVNPFSRKVRIVGAKYARLPESYYVPEYHERNEPVDVELCDLPAFRLYLERPSILGIEPERAYARVEIGRKFVRLDDVPVEWPERSPRMSVDGTCKVDLKKQRFAAKISGLALQHHIRPLLVALDIPVAMPYFDGFTQVTNPVPAKAEFDVDLVNCDFAMKLDLRPEMGRYNGVPMARAVGEIEVRNRIRGTNCMTQVKIDLQNARDRLGRLLSGVLEVDCSNDLARVSMDVRSGLDFDDIVAIADFIDKEAFSDIKCESAPTITAHGHIGTCVEDMGYNAIEGNVRIPKCTINGLRLHDCEFDYSFKEDKLEFQRVKAVARHGGVITARSLIDLSEFNETNATFETKIDYVNGELDELSDVFGLDLAGRNGKLEAHIEMSGLASTNSFEKLNGKGSVKIEEGHLLQMNLFAGLTALLAEQVPGGGYIVNQSDASVDFIVEDGVFRTENMYLEGGLVSLKGSGSYDAVKDEIDFVVRVQFMKKESFMGKVLHSVAFPFTKLLLEFKATGSISDPKWDYISILDRVF